MRHVEQRQKESSLCLFQLEFVIFFRPPTTGRQLEIEIRDLVRSCFISLFVRYYKAMPTFVQLRSSCLINEKSRDIHRFREQGAGKVSKMKPERDSIAQCSLFKFR